MENRINIGHTDHETNKIEEFVTKNDSNSLIILEGKLNEALNSIEPSDEFNKKMMKQFSQNSERNKLFDFIFMKKFALGIAAIVLILSVIGVYLYTNSKLGLNPNKNDIADDKNDTDSSVNDDVVLPIVQFKNIDMSSWRTQRMKHDPENAMDIRVPADWKFNTLNNGETYSLIAPSGSAWGYDFYIPTKLVDCSGKTLVKINDTYSRYFDEQSHAATNWYICEMVNGKLQLIDGNTYTFYAKSEEDLAILDAMMASLVKVFQPGVSVTPTPDVSSLKEFKSTRYNVSFKYPASMGDAKVVYNEAYYKDEIITFTNSSVNLTYPRWEGGFAGNANLLTMDLKSKIAGMENEVFTLNYFNSIGMSGYDSTDAHIMKSISNTGANIFISTGNCSTDAKYQTEISNLKVIVENLYVKY